MVSWYVRRSSSTRRSWHATCALGFSVCRPMSALAWRAATMNSSITWNWVSLTGSATRSLTNSKLVSEMEGPRRARGSWCQSSSVMNGMNGCNKCSAASKTRARLIQQGGVRVPSMGRVISGFTHSRYQSQNSCQKK